MRIHKMQYNQQRNAFEASIDITRNGVTYRYPCQLRGPANMDPSVVQSAMAAQAMAMSDTPRA